MRKSLIFFCLTAVLLTAAPVFAQGGGAAATSNQWVVITAGFAMAIASGV